MPNQSRGVASARIGIEVPIEVIAAVTEVVIVVRGGSVPSRNLKRSHPRPALWKARRFRPCPVNCRAAQVVL